MKYSEMVPSPHLAHFVKCFWSLEQSKFAVADTPELIVPDGCVEIVFNLADRYQRFHSDSSVEIQPASIIAGQMNKSVLIRPTGNVNLFGIRFQPAGAYPFFDFPLYELNGRIEGIDAVLGAAGTVVEEKINEANSFAERVEAFEILLTNRLTGNKKIDTILNRAVAMICRNQGTIPVDSVARISGISERGLERKFKQKAGLSPKLFSRIVRFQNVLKFLKNNKTGNVSDTALSFGYFDQSHMIHEFKEFSGKSPNAFIGDSHRMTELFTAGD
ncbi:MAG: AraC family transcriptional regulator [Saprospiraceae bacterium]|nr:AraC family transcriptional regulator [Pyrinomonadaceae bacterium]